MGYNKFIEEQKWLKWKEAEEKQLRNLGVDESIIKRLHEYDKEQFNQERRYREKQVAWSGYIDWYSAQFLELPVEDVASLLDSIEDAKLWLLLSKENKTTIRILLYTIQGFTSAEIANKTGLQETTVRKRVSRLKKKLKTFLS